MKKNLTLLAALIGFGAFAQNKIEVKGVLYNEQNKAKLIDTDFTIVDLDINGITDHEGNFIIEVPEDIYEIELRVNGFQTIIKTISSATSVNLFLQPEDIGKVDLTTILITGKREKSSEASLLNMQKKSMEIVERIGANQLTKQGISDVASAVVKASGTIKQEGTGVIFVRGLGDRFNSTTLNGFLIPSDNPEYKNINLGIFKTNMVDYISLEKSFYPRMIGDFTGGNIDITSKEYIGKSFVRIGVSNSFNLQTVGSEQFKKQDGSDFIGFKQTELIKNPNPVKQYTFTTSWNPIKGENLFGTGLNIETGGNLKIGSSGKLSIYGYAGFDNDYIYTTGEENVVSSVGTYMKRLAVNRSTYSTNTNGLLNIIYSINTNNKLAFISNFIHSSEQDFRIFQGYLMDTAENGKAYIQRADNKMTSIYVNQLFGEHKFSKDWQLNWGGSYNNILSNRPNRMQNSMVFDDKLGGYVLMVNSPGDNNRYYDQLNGADLQVKFDLTKKWDKLKVTFGSYGFYKKRDFEATQINLRARTSTQLVDPNNLDAFFNRDNFNNGLIELSTFRGLGTSNLPNLLSPLSYKAEQQIFSAYVNAEYELAENFLIQAGLRNDFINLMVDWNTNVGQLRGKVDRNYNKILPSLNMKYSLNDNQNLRLSASKTYTLPQVKEMAPFAYDDVTTTTYGQSSIYPSDNYNTDLKWEIFPTKEEVISVTAFGKYIKNPITRVNVASASANDLTYVNTGNYGYVYGLELEFRKNLIQFSNDSKLYAIINAAVLNSKQELNFDKVRDETGISSAFTNSSEQMMGASPFSGNISLGYSVNFDNQKKLDAMLVYGYVSENIYAIGTQERGSQVQKGINLLDINLRYNISDKASFSINGKNLLNPAIRISQKNSGTDYILNTYNRGIQLGIGFSYKL